MAELLHEYWEDEDGGWYSPVSARGDEQRAAIHLTARLVFSLYASSWKQAMQMRNERLDYGEYVPHPDMPDIFYTEDEREIQDAYLAIRLL